MSLSHNDLQAIRKIVEEAIDPLKGELEALRNDIKDIYNMVVDLQSKVLPDTQFQKLSIEEKLLRLNSELLAAAKQAGITLPR